MAEITSPLLSAHAMTSQKSVENAGTFAVFVRAAIRTDPVSDGVVEKRSDRAICRVLEYHLRSCPAKLRTRCERTAETGRVDAVSRESTSLSLAFERTLPREGVQAPSVCRRP